MLQLSAVEKTRPPLAGKVLIACKTKWVKFIAEPSRSRKAGFLSSESQFRGAGKEVRPWDHNQRNLSLKMKHMTTSLHTGGNSSVSG